MEKFDELPLNEMTVGELVAFNMLAAQVSGPVLRLVQVWQDFHQVRLSVERLGDILNTPVEANRAGTQSEHAAIEGAIRLLDSPGVPVGRGNIVATGSTEIGNSSR